MSEMKVRKSPALEKMKNHLRDKHWKKESMIIAMRILYTLDEKGLTQKNLAEKLGKSPQWVNKICKGQQNLTIGTIKELEEALDISLFEIPPLKEEKLTLKPNKTKLTYSTSKSIISPSYITELNSASLAAEPEAPYNKSE